MGQGSYKPPNGTSSKGSVEEIIAIEEVVDKEILNPKGSKIFDDPEKLDDRSNNLVDDEVFDYDFIRQLSSDSKRLFGYSYDARFIVKPWFHGSPSLADVVVPDTSVILRPAIAEHLLYLLKQGMPVATTVSVLEELAFRPQQNHHLSESQQQQRKNIMLAIAATGLLFDFSPHHERPEYRLLWDLGRCTSKSYAAAFLKTNLGRWDPLLTNCIRGHALYNQLSAWEEASLLAKETILNDVMGALFKGWSMPTSQTRSFTLEQRPTVAIASIMSQLNGCKSRIVRNTAQTLTDVLGGNSEYALDGASAQEVVASYGEKNWFEGCNRYIRRIVGSRLSQIIDAEVQGHVPNPYHLKTVFTAADTEVLLLSYLLANSSSTGSILFAANDGSKAMPSFDQPMSEQVAAGFPCYRDYVPISRTPQITLATRDADHREALHLLKHIQRK